MLDVIHMKDIRITLKEDEDSALEYYVKRPSFTSKRLLPYEIKGKTANEQMQFNHFVSIQSF
ncbi:hypothetical protein [Gottfriedia acidiceleris]|uniref:hypothetical protein n=1 Tax=Gottfriedia acidiceleris TaxID=371036 RepID=UPI002FFFF1DB